MELLTASLPSQSLLHAFIHPKVTMSIPPSPHSSQPSRASTPSPKNTPDASNCPEPTPVCAYHHLRLLQESNRSQDELPSNSAPNQSHTSRHPDESVNPLFERTELSSVEMTVLSIAGIEFSRSQFLNLGFPFPESHPVIPLIQETVNNRAARWRAGVQLVFPNLEERYLDTIESETKLGILYHFLALYLSSRESGSEFNFSTHEATPGA